MEDLAHRKIIPISFKSLPVTSPTLWLQNPRGSSGPFEGRGSGLWLTLLDSPHLIFCFFIRMIMILML